jgi:hypothetical protein
VSNQVCVWLVRNCGANGVELLQLGFYVPQMLRSERSRSLQHGFSTRLSMFLVRQGIHRKVGFISNVGLWFHKVV